MSFRSDRGGDMYGRAMSGGLMGLMREHGRTVLGVEIAALAAASFGAMALDRLANVRMAKRAAKQQDSSESDLA